MKAIRAILVASLAIWLVALPARASLETDLLDRWYALLAKADAPALSGLIAANATIELVDLDIAQTKQEFLDSMEEFSAALSNGSIRYRIESASANAAVALVCYDFASNDVLARERFNFSSGLVAGSVQTKVADDCSQLPQ